MKVIPPNRRFVKYVDLNEGVVERSQDRLVVVNQILFQLVKWVNVGVLPGIAHEHVYELLFGAYRIVGSFCGNAPLEGVLLWMVLSHEKGKFP